MPKIQRGKWRISVAHSSAEPAIAACAIPTPAESVIDVTFRGQYRVVMSSRNRDIEKQARSLPHKERARLALSLIESLDPGTDEDAEALWLQEARKRLEAYDTGKAQSRPVNDVIAEIKSGLK